MGRVLRSDCVSRGSGSLAYRMDTASHDAMQDMLGVYNPVLGPARKLISYLPSVGTLPIFVGHCEYFDYDLVAQRLTGRSALDTGVKGSLFSGGKGADPHGMFLSTLGETVERVLGSMQSFATEDHHLFGSYRELTAQGHRCLSPAELPLFSAAQYASPSFLFEPFTEDSPLGWIRGERLLSGTEIWMPAQMVHLVYMRKPGEATIGYAVSGGLSSHVSRLHALFHGITELIERDAVNLRWYCGLAPERIRIDRAARRADLRRLLEAADRLPGTIAFYNHSIDIPEVPVITAVRLDRWAKRYGYCSGGGADTDIDVALAKSLTEFGQSERMIRMRLTAPSSSFARTISRQFEMGPDDDPSEIDIFFKVVSYYGHAQNVDRLAWYLDGGDDVALSDLPVESGDMAVKYEHLLGVLARHGLDPIVFDLTPPDLPHLALVKVFMGELTQPFIQSLPMFGHPRFREAPRLLDGREPLDPAQLVRDPLPYP